MKYYPPLARLISREALPADIAFLGNATETAEQVLDQLLRGIGFKDLVINQSAEGDVKSYSLAIVAKEFGFELFGTGVSLLFFPGALGTDDANIPVAFDWRWTARRYLRNLEAAFSYSPQAFFDLFFQLANISESEFVDSVVKTFIDDPAPYVRLVQDIKALVADYSNHVATLKDETGEILANAPAVDTLLDGLIADLQNPGQLATPFDSEAEYIADRFYEIADQLDIDLDVCQVAFETVTRDLTAPSDIRDRLVTLFRTWFGGFDKQQIEDLLVPQFSIALTQIPIALEFPRKWLVPLIANTATPDPNELAKSRLTFNVGSVRYSTKTGITFEGENSFSFTRSMIGKTGLTFGIDSARIDFSRTSNIPEATAAGYPVDFVGVYIKYVEIDLPEKWFVPNQSSSGPATLAIVGRDLLLGPGGVTGTIGLEAIPAGTPDPNQPIKPSPGAKLEFVLGQQPTSSSVAPRKGFVLGFSTFDMKFRQNALLESTIKGSLTVPRFNPNPIDIELHLSGDGDFEITASTPNGYDFTFPNVFVFRAREVKVGKDDNRVFLRTTGDLIFPPQSILGALITKPIHLEKLLIHSDGSMELEGGSVPLPESVVLPIGPVKITVTAIHFGSHTQEYQGVPRDYNYFGLDAAVNVDPGKCGGKGDGIKFYYTVDDASHGGVRHHFLRIEGLRIDLVFPSSASEDEAALALKGYLALKDPVYEGSVSFKLLKGKIVGGASMKYDTSYPAWIVDANLELPQDFPLGSTSLGFYTFRGMFGWHYIASKAAIGPPQSQLPPLDPDASWGDYYRALQPQKGVWIDKFVPPEKTGGSSNPFSVGVGVGLETQADRGRTFSAQLFLMVSLPNVAILEGRADLLAQHHVAVDDDPPYYAYLALSPDSVEIGAGVNYLLPKSSGEILNLNAVLEAAFFFHNRSAWYLDVGTKSKPVTARIISLFDGYSYLMLSASGMEMGAGVHFDFNKTYGPVHVAAHAYLDTWAYIAFERFQAGGAIALGGHVDIKLFKFGLYIELAAVLTLELPHPFLVAGSVEVCVSVDLKVKTFHKCCELEFRWERDTSTNRVPVLTMSDPTGPPAAVAVHMVSGSTYPVEFSNNPNPQRTDTLIPLDAYVDVKFTKPVNPSKVAASIGGYTSPPSGEIEIMPPKYGSRIVRHAYWLDDVKIEALDGSGNWVAYHPYTALSPDASLNADTVAQLDALPLGVWQKQDPTYSQIRFLALTPFSWMSDAVGFSPEEMGVTPKSTYCVAREREEHCLLWDVPAHYEPDRDYASNGMLYRVEGDRVEALSVAQPGLAPVSLAIAPHGRAVFRFLERIVSCRIMLYSTAPYVTVHWQRRKPPPANSVVFPPWTPPEFEDAVPPLVVPRAALANPVLYNNPAVAIERIVLETPLPDVLAIAGLEERIALRTEDFVRANATQRPVIAREIAILERQLQAEHDKACIVDHRDTSDVTRQIRELTSSLDAIQKQIHDRQDTYNSFCVAPPTPGKNPPMSAADCLKLADAIAALTQQATDIQVKLVELRGQLQPFAPDWECGTFVHEICWMTEADRAYNESIPGMVAIEADYSRMRAAVEGKIAPVWKPRARYRITLTTSDTVTDENNNTPAPTPQHYYVHFRTPGPLGHCDALKTSPPMIGTPNPAATVPDDGRPEIPERALKFYIDEKSTPDPGGNLLYAKPIYYRNVVLRLFFSNPHAYHFFTQWPNRDCGPRGYALELAVKDPAEAPPPDPNLPPPAPNETPFRSAALLGLQEWVTDDSPRIAQEIKTIRTFQNPLLDGGTHATACLVSGGAPIKPLGKSLKVSMGDLERNKLYTAVVLNRSLDEGTVAEVARYAFKTSLYPDYASHIASYKLSSDAGDARLAVFTLEHALASAADEALVLAGALAIVLATPTTDTAAYPDPFDRLLYGHLKLAPLAPAASLEFNFMVNSATHQTYGIWIRSREPLIDPRVTGVLLDQAIKMRVNGVPSDAAFVLCARDRCQAFVMVSGGAFPTQDISFVFTGQVWNGNGYDPEQAATDPFAKP